MSTTATGPATTRQPTTRTAAATSLGDIARTSASLRTFLHGLPGVDAVGVEARAAMLGTRSIKTTAKAYAIDLAIRMVDLTTLEGADTSGKVRALCAKGRHPDAQMDTGNPCPPVAAICIYPSMVPVAVAELAGSGIHVASVATAFPSGQAPLDVKLADTTAAVDAGADEIDMVINRGAFLAGDYLSVYDEIVAVKEACRHAHLKVILETGELATYDNVRRASWLAMAAGADFIKTSTGKEGVNATLPVTLAMLRMIRVYQERTGYKIGFKPAGGISTAKDVLNYQFLMKEELGRDWLEPDLFRVGASSLLADIERQLEHHVTGRYSAFNRHPVG